MQLPTATSLVTAAAARSGRGYRYSRAMAARSAVRATKKQGAHPKRALASDNIRRVAFWKRMRRLRKERRFHTYLQTRLSDLCSELFPGLHPIREIQGLAGGRNDLMFFEFNGRKVLIEIFGTRSQVSRDLRLLDNTQADVKMAVIIDKEVDPRVFEQFLRENPERNYPFIFASEVADPARAHIGRLKLYEVVTHDERYRFARYLREFSSTALTRLLSECKRDGLVVFTKDDIKAGTISFAAVFVVRVMQQLGALGVQPQAIKKVVTWLSKPNAVEFVFRQVSLGLNMFLYTDISGNYGFYSDTELLDWLRAGPSLPGAYVLLSANAIVLEISNKYLKKKLELPSEPRMSVGQCQILESGTGRAVLLSVPLRTKEIVIIPPMTADGRRGLTGEEIVSAIQVEGAAGMLRCRPFPRDQEPAGPT